jgi:hypothetical protein
MCSSKPIFRNGLLHFSAYVLGPVLQVALVGQAVQIPSISPALQHFIFTA